MSHVETVSQTNHVAEVLRILLDAYGTASPWVSGQTLAHRVGSRNTSARIGALKAQGYQIESRPEGGEAGWHAFRLVSPTPGEPQARSWLRLRLPAGTWSASEERALQRAAEDALLASAEALRAKRPAPTALAADPSLSTDEFIDQLLAMVEE